MKDKKLKKLICLLLFSLLFLYSELLFSQTSNQKEFRGIWIATINNLDWPSAPGLPVEQQKKELRDLVERIEKFKLNAVFLQVRAAADAFYASSIEPWSYFLTGKQGKATDPFFDPLSYAVELCHSRGIELYAWFNPFRVRNLGYYPLAKNSFASKYPQYQHDYDNKRFFDPGFPQVREHVIKVILEVVRKYEIDGVLLDDYFYPYPVKGKSFPDSKTFAKYGMEFYPKRLKDWRRENINAFISNLQKGIKSIKPDLKLGISPFGIWRTKSDDPNGSPLLKGTTSFDDLYADVYRWLLKNWIDFVVPQLYWEQGNRYGDFNAMTKWWNDHSFGKSLYLGQALYRSSGSDKAWTNPKEISDQISIMRKYNNVKGFAFFSASHLAKLPQPEINMLTALLSTSKDSLSKETTLKEKLLTTTADTRLTLLPDKRSFDSVINLQNRNNTAVLKSAAFKIRKKHSAYQLSWSIPDSLKSDQENHFLLAYQPKKDSGYLKKVYSFGDQKEIIIRKDVGYNPRKFFYSLVSFGPIHSEPQYSRLFKLRRNKFVYQ